MKTLRLHLEDYLRLRRQLGFKLHDAGIMLRNFVRFAQEQGASHIGTDLAVRWATLPQDIQPMQRAKRLGEVRRFAQYVKTHDPRTQIPARTLLPYQVQRPDPYHYRQDQVLQLVEAAQQVDPLHRIKGPTLSTLLGLLAVTGMRVGEALSLNREDVQWGQGLLIIRSGKGNKSRLVPLHSSTVQALQRYTHLRDEVYPRPLSPSFFVWNGGSRALHGTIHRWFLLIACQLGLRQPGARRGPRMHDLRHHFAIRTLLNWYKSNADVEARLPQLATFLGHAHVCDSYWYLSAVPELLELATQRWERAQKGQR